MEIRRATSAGSTVMRTIDILKPAANSISIQRLVFEFDRLLHKYPQETVPIKDGAGEFAATNQSVAPKFRDY